ncbi:MAG TPA: GNAT family N-acetyltransferase [Burkholderiales bacterium]|nr:GNAT family N-acetyltransferase [Burkholderiales bacterium]
MTFAHRVASREDLPQIIAIYNATIPSRMVTADLEPVSVASRVRWFEEHSADFRPLWVVEAEAQVAGWLSFSSFYGRPAYNKTAELSVYIHAAFRKRGIASYLLTRALAQAPGLGIDTVLGFIFGHNLTSLALFDKFGFARWGELPKVALLDGVERDVIIVGRRV